jgi:transcriptional regulator with XRE-family HTH domain
MKERRQNREEMEALLALRQSEGLTYRELAERSGIPTHTLNYWAMKFRKESQVNEDEPELLRVELLDQEIVYAIPIELGGGIRVLVEPGFDADHLRNIVKALSRSC